MWVFRDKRNKICYVIGDGNHRVAIAILRGEEIRVEVVGRWSRQKKPYGFNKILQQIKEIFPDSLDIDRGPFGP